MGGWTQTNRDTIKWDGSFMVNNLQINPASSGSDLLNFNTERAWRFKSSGTGATTELRLSDKEGSKTFYFEDEVNNKYLKIMGGTIGMRSITSVPKITAAKTSAALYVSAGALWYRRGKDVYPFLAAW